MVNSSVAYSTTHGEMTEPIKSIPAPHNETVSHRALLCASLCSCDGNTSASGDVKPGSAFLGLVTPQRLPSSGEHRTHATHMYVHPQEAHAQHLLGVFKETRKC